MLEHRNASVIGRLLEEISWEGSRVREYRDGGRGRENVLTAEVLLPLTYLPRDEFLGEVFRSAHGAEEARLRIASELEEADITLLPDESRLSPDVAVQPDAVIVTPSCHVLVEAKRTVAGASFQSRQLAREYLALHKDAGDKTALLLLILGAAPPVAVRGHGRLDLIDAVSLHLENAYVETHGLDTSLNELVAALPATLAWTTWHEVKEVVERQVQTSFQLEGGVGGTVRRLAEAVSTAVEWHSRRPQP